MRRTARDDYERSSAVVTGGPGGPYPPNDCLCPPFRFAQNTFLERDVMISQQAIMEKQIIMFKDNSHLKFFRFLAKLRATNCFCATQYVNVMQ